MRMDVFWNAVVTELVVVLHDGAYRIAVLRCQPIVLGGGRTKGSLVLQEDCLDVWGVAQPGAHKRISHTINNVFCFN
jgi:hypothetical protein